MLKIVYIYILHIHSNYTIIKLLNDMRLNDMASLSKYRRYMCITYRKELWDIASKQEYVSLYNISILRLNKTKQGVHDTND